MSDKAVMPEDRGECVLWLRRYHTLKWYRYISEHDAAWSATCMSEEDGYVSVLGVQFPDGATIKYADSWPMRDYVSAERRKMNERERVRQSPRKVVRRVRNPFDGDRITPEYASVYAGEDAPAWLGRWS